MPYTPRQLQVLTKYKVLLPDGSRAQCTLTDGAAGPLMGDEALMYLLAADSTPDGLWLDWIFFQAGGGAEAEAQREKAVEEIKAIYYEERLNGFTHPVDHHWVAPRPRAEVDERWHKAEPTFREMLRVVDADAVVRMQGTFGYYRNWPGRNGIYADVANAVSGYLDVEDRAAGSGQGEATPENTRTWQALRDKTRAIIRFYAARDVRHATTKKFNDVVYEDDILKVIVPLTYPASVKYGHPNWRFSNPKQFKEVVAGKPHFDWKTTVGGGGFFAFLYFKVPVPGWVSDGEQYWLTNLALELPMRELSGDASSPPDDWKVWDEQNHYEITIARVKEMILQEPQRQRTPDMEDQPIDGGAPVVKSAEEAQVIVQHIDAALAALLEWAKDFDWAEFSPDLTKMPG